MIEQISEMPEYYSAQRKGGPAYLESKKDRRKSVKGSLIRNKFKQMKSQEAVGEYLTGL